MSSSIVFTGSGFFIVSAQQQVPGTVRVRYSGQPKAFNAINVDDALNPSNYAIAGPGPAVISTINPVLGDVLSYDIVLTGILIQGSWTITVTNVQNLNNSPLVAPTAATFFVVASPQSGLTDGASQDDAESIIRKHLNPALKGDGWNALIAGLSKGDNTVWAFAQSAYDQLFLSTASGSYLAKRGSDIGISKPVGVGINENVFRKYAIKNHANKVVQEAIREILEAFYGEDSLRAFAEAALDENYNLSGGPTLTWTLDETQDFSFTFVPTQFASSTKARAIEVAVMLTKYMHDRGSNGFALAVQNATTGGYRVRIYSGSLGLRSSVRVTGGNAQNQFHFPDYVEVYSTQILAANGYTWVVSTPDPDTTTFTLNTTGVGLVNLYPVQVGDYVLIGSDANMGITGQFTVKDVSVTWTGKTVQHNAFSIERVATTGSGLQLSNDAYRFFRPTRKTTNAGSRTVVVSQSVDGRIDIRIPATTQAVSRGPKTAIYGNVQESNDIIAFTRSDLGVISVATNTAHGLNVGDHVIFEGVEPSPYRPYVYSFARIPTGPGNSRLWEDATQKSPVSTVDCFWIPQSELNVPITYGGSFGRFGDTNSWVSVGGIGGGRGIIVDDLGVDPAPLNLGMEADGQTPANFSLANSYVSPGGDCRIAPLGSKDVLVVGGGGIVFDRVTARTIGTPTVVNGPPNGCEVVPLPNGEVYAMGGADIGQTASVACFRYISDGNMGAIVTNRADMNLARCNFRAVALTPTKILVSGGRMLRRFNDTTFAWNFFSYSDVALARWFAVSAPAGDDSGVYNLTAVGAPQPFSAGNYYTAPGDVAAADVLNDEWTAMWWFDGSEGTHWTYGGTGTGGTPDENILFRFATSGGIYTWQLQNGNNTDVTGTGPVAFEGGNPWTHCAVRKRKSANGSNYDIDVFFNGLLAGSTQGIVGSDGGANASWYIGYDPQQPSGPTNEYQGFIQNFWFYKQPLNSAGIVSEWQYGDGWYDGSVGGTGGAPGELTNRCEIFDTITNTWTEIAPMNLCRAYHEMFTLPDGRVMVVGGMGKSPGQFADEFNGDAVVTSFELPNHPLNECEIYDPGSGTWQFTAPLNVKRIHPTGYLDPVKNTITVFGGWNDPSFLGFGQVVGKPSTARHEIFDIRTQTWRVSAAASLLVSEVTNKFDIDFSGDRGGGSASVALAVLDNGTVLVSRDNSGKTSANGAYTGTPGYDENQRFAPFQGFIMGQPLEIFVPASSTVSSGGLNGQFRVTAVPTTTSFQVETTEATEFIYAMNVRGGDSGIYRTYGNPIQITSITRAGSVVTATISSSKSLKVGDLVQVNLNGTTAFPSGRKTVASIPTGTTFTYAEGGTAGTQTVQGGVSILLTDPSEFGVAQLPNGVNAQGPFLFDPDGGTSYTGTEGLLYGDKVFKNEQHGDIEVTVTNGSFPDAGYLIFQLGYADQSSPIKYTTTYTTVPGRKKLVIDYAYKFEFDYDVGTRITLMASRESFEPQSLIGSAYITGSISGRTAAKAATVAALAAGIDPNISIIYPGDRGLGGEGQPTEFSEKLSDAVTVWSGDDTDEEVAAAKVGD